MLENKSICILRLRKVIEKTGLSRSSIYALINSGTFVPKIQISKRSIGFLQSDLDQWISERVEFSKEGVK